MDGRTPLSAAEIIRNAQRKIVADINENVRRTEQLQKFCEDYSRLDTTLATLADQTSYPLMVPLGPMAFMPGRAVHTNEVFVLLGENYFVERSTKQAREIIDRRLTVLKEEVKTLNEEYEAMRGRLGVTEEMQQGHEELGVGNIVDIREEYHSDDEDEEDQKRRPRIEREGGRAGPKPTTAEDDAEEERRMARLMQLLALEEEEEEKKQRTNHGGQNETAPGEKEATSAEVAPHGTKRPKSCLKGDSIDHVNKSVRIMAPGETEAVAPSAYPQRPSPLSTMARGFNSAFTGAVVERPPPEPTREMESLFLGHRAPPASSAAPTTSSMATPGGFPSHAPLPIVPMMAMAPPILSTPPVTAGGPSSFAYGIPTPQQQQQQQQQLHVPYHQAAMMSLSDGSGGIVSLTVLGGGTGPAHTIPIMPQQQQQQHLQQQQQQQQHVGVPSMSSSSSSSSPASSSPLFPHAPTTSPVIEERPRSSSTTTTTTTHKRAFRDSPVVGRRSSVGGGDDDDNDDDLPGMERPSVLGSAFSGAVVEREAPSPQLKEEETVQPPKKMSRFRAMRSGAGDKS